MEICKKLKMSPGFKEKEQSSANAVLCDLSDFIINLAFVDLFPIYIFLDVHSMNLLYRSVRRFGLDFSNLSKAVTSEGTRNYKIPLENPIDGYLTANSEAPCTVIMIH